MMGADLYIRPICRTSSGTDMRRSTSTGCRYAKHQSARTNARKPKSKSGQSLLRPDVRQRLFPRQLQRQQSLVKFRALLVGGRRPATDRPRDVLELDQAAWLLQTLKEREPVFHANTARDPGLGLLPSRRYRELRTFLRLALQRNEPIECSM